MFSPNAPTLGHLNQLFGQVQMADALAQFSKTVFISKLAFVKENKLYQSLIGKQSEDSFQFSGTWWNFDLMLEDDTHLIIQIKATVLSLFSRDVLLNLPRKARVKRSEPSFSELQGFSYVHTKNVSK